MISEPRPDDAPLDGRRPATANSGLVGLALAVLTSALFVALVWRALDTLVSPYDEGWYLVDARLVLRGLHPLADFVHHQPPLHLYLLALSGRLFGETVFGFRMLSLASVAASGVVLFALARSVVGMVPALVAQAAFLFATTQVAALAAMPETPMVLFTLIGALLLFRGDRPRSAWAAAVAFVVALLVKPTCLPTIAAAALSLAAARAWRRLAHFAIAGVAAGIAGLAWTFVASRGVFGEVLRFHVARLATRQAGMWAIDSGFADMRRALGIETPLRWAAHSFASFYETSTTTLPIALFALSLAGIPVWVARCARSRPALAAFAVLWPASCAALNFAGVDFASATYFIPFLAFSAFLLAGVVDVIARALPRHAASAAGALACVALVAHFVWRLDAYRDPWFFGRAEWIGEHYPTVVSFTPMLFAATTMEPACGLANPALAYGSFGETLLGSERTRRFHVTDEHLVDCLRAHPDVPVVIDWAYFFFTRPGSALREYLRGDGSAQRLFFSPQALAQWDRAGPSAVPAGR